MIELLKYLEQQKTDGDPYQYQFQNQANKKDLEKLETYFDGVIPEQFLDFLKSHNGGFICNGHWAEYIWETGNKSLPEESSIYLYSANEIIENANQVQSYAEIIVDFEFVKFIPIAKALNGKIVLMKNEVHSPVFLIDLYDTKCSLTQMYPDFKSFFSEYIQNEGYIKALF